MTPFSSWKFFFLNIASAFSWSIVFTLAGYLFGKSASLFVGQDIKKYEHYIFAILAGIICLIWLWHIYRAWMLRASARSRLKRMKKRICAY
jgi:membrane protein DedA with SNARE-associated domain